MNIIIGTLTVFLIALSRFNVPPPSQQSLPLPRSLADIGKWFQLKPLPEPAILTPIRANTTLFRFGLYRTVYAVIGVTVYLLVSKVPGLAADVQSVINLFAGSEQVFVLKDAGPFVLAILVAVVLPAVPPFRWADATIRRALYEHASIPAEQLNLQARLKRASYEVAQDALLRVRAALEAEGFNPDDLVYEAKPTTRSLWTKLSVLIEYVEHWRGEDKYKTAFAVLKEHDGKTRSRARVKEAYEALKGDARTCFAARREHTGERETQDREEHFRRQCKALLESIYALLSRVSLHSHYSERDRVVSMRAIGFALELPQGGPIPDPDDLVWLGILLGAVIILPLWHTLGLAHALTIAGIYFVATLTPIMLVAHCPRFTMKHNGRTPAITCPFVAGTVATLVGAAISVVTKSAMSPAFPWIDLVSGWEIYVTRSYPWSFVVFLVAALIAVRIRGGSYPEVCTLKGLARYREWGSFADAALFAGTTAALIGLLVQPELARLAPERFVHSGWRLAIVPAMTTFVIGFLVPTWYRANALRQSRERVASSGGAAHQPDAQPAAL
jgi:hypothetical protein